MTVSLRLGRGGLGYQVRGSDVDLQRPMSGACGQGHHVTVGPARATLDGADFVVVLVQAGQSLTIELLAARVHACRGARGPRSAS